MKLKDYRVGLLILFTLIYNCKSRIDIFDECSNDSTYSINNHQMNEIVDMLLENEDLKIWAESELKVLLIRQLYTNNNIHLITIPTFQKKHMIPALKNDYSAYSEYRDVLIIYWGDEDMFFSKKRNVVRKKIFEPEENVKNEKNIFPKPLAEYYGYEFMVANDEVTVVKEDFFYIKELEISN